MLSFCEAVESGSEILTDGWSGYNSLSEHSYTHSKTVLSETGDPAHARPGRSTPGVGMRPPPGRKARESRRLCTGPGAPASPSAQRARMDASLLELQA